MKVIKYWTIKIFFITLILSAGVSVITEYFMSEVELAAAVGVLAALIVVGIIFDIVGVAFASCDQEPFIAMSAKKDMRAHQALKLLKNADIVSNFCNDVIGDICSIVSGAAGAAITLKAIVMGLPASDFTISIVVSALISASTVAGKAAGKTVAMKKNKEIVMIIGGITNFFRPGKKKKNEKKS